MKALILFSTFMLLVPGALFALPAASGSPPSRVLITGPITTDTEYPEGTYEVKTLCTIETGVEVIFNAGSTIVMQGDVGETGFEVYGILYLEGTEAKPVRVISSEAVPLPGYWDSIIFAPGSHGWMNSTYMEHATNGVYIYYGAEVEIKNSEIRNCSENGIFFQDRFSSGQYSFPEGSLIENTGFFDNPVGITENGNGSIIKDCLFQDQGNTSIVLSGGISPRSENATITGCTFRENGFCDILVNTTGDPLQVQNLSVKDCSFQNIVEPLAFHLRINDGIKGLELIGNEFLPSTSKERVKINGGQDMLIEGNDLYSGVKEVYTEYSLQVYDFKEMTIRDNIFTGTYPITTLSYSDTYNVMIWRGEGLDVYGNSFLKGCDNNLDICEVKDVRVENNTFREWGLGIRALISAPLLLKNNDIARTEMPKWAEPPFGIYVQGSGLVDTPIPKVLIEKNIINRGSGIKIGWNDFTKVRENLIETELNGTAFEFLTDGQGGDETFLMENNTVVNISATRTKIDARRANVTIHFINTTVNQSRMDMGIMGDYTGINYWGDVYFTNFMKVRVEDEIGGPMEFKMNIRDRLDHTWLDRTYSGVTPLISGPIYHYHLEDYLDYTIEDPRSTYCYYNVTSGALAHSGFLNHSAYTEMDLVLDGAPVLSGTGAVHIQEDVPLEFDPSDLFFDLDTISVETIEEDANLTFDGGYISNRYENWTGTGQMTFRATDTMGNWTEGPVQFVVDPVNDLPVFDPPLPELTFDEDTNGTISLSDHIKDGEGDDVEVTFGTLPGSCTVAFDESSMELTITPLKDVFGEFELPIYLNDTLGVTEGVLRFEVVNVNDPPFFVVPPEWNVTVDPGTIFSIDLTDFLEDIDSSGVVFSVISDHATVTGSILKILYSVNTEATIGTITINADDGDGGTATCQLLVYVRHGPPTPEWELDSALVDIDDDGNWLVTTTGPSGLDIYMIIDGVGSFKLEEDQEHPGNYSLTIPDENFEDGVSYSYHFSDEAGGVDKAPTLSDEVTQPEVDKDDGPLWSLYIICCGTIVVIGILVLIGLIMLATRKKEVDWEE